MDYTIQSGAKVSGYLEKKGKLRMMSSFKKYWFVLEGRLLLYYRSKDEYDAISPCKGSITLGPPSAVRSCPSVTHGFQIESRTNTITLKAENATEQKKWMQALMFALNQNQNKPPESTPKLSHFRYSLDNLIPKCDSEDSKKALGRQNTMPNNDIVQRLQKIGAQTYGGSLGAITKVANRSLDNQALCDKGAKTSSHSSLPNDNNRRQSAGSLVAIRRSISSLKSSKDNIYERLSGDSQLSNKSKNFMIDNDNYSIPVKMKPRLSTDTFLIENEQYCTANETAKSNQKNDEIELYSEPNRMFDNNANPVAEENPYYEVTDRNSENEYEDLDKYRNLYSTPNFQNCAGDQDHDISSQSSEERSNVKEMAKKLIEKKLCKQGLKPDKSEKKVKKSQSFITRVWRRKNKKGRKSPERDEIQEEPDSAIIHKTELNKENTIQLLSELQNLLQDKKPILEKTLSSSSSKTEKSEQHSPPAITFSEAEPESCPSLPPKQHKSQHQDSIKSNQSFDQIEPVRSLDEILEDLSKEKVEPKNKVRMLIEKFSEQDTGSEGEVVLRKHNIVLTRPDRHSDELTVLLNELAKVTSAPVLTPGVTNSLVNPSLTDEEWLKVLPIRQRRLSEPDYDVPRPHKAIQTLSKQENSDAIPATRFFGPALSSGVQEMQNKEDLRSISITPDSLELEHNQKLAAFSYSSHNYHDCPNTGRQFATNFSYFPHDCNRYDDKIIYAMPKPYISVATHIVNTCENICSPIYSEENTIIYKNVRNMETSQEEIFKDSLELCSEASTEF